MYSKVSGLKWNSIKEEFVIKYVAGSGNVSIFFYEDEKHGILWIPLDAVFWAKFW